MQLIRCKLMYVIIAKNEPLNRRREQMIYGGHKEAYDNGSNVQCVKM